MKMERLVPNTKVAEWSSQVYIRRTVPFDGSSQGNAAVSIANFDLLNNPAGTYWFKTPSMASALQMYYVPAMADSKGWVRVFSSPYNGTATLNLLGNSIDWKGILVQRNDAGLKQYGYYTNSVLYNTKSDTATLNSGPAAGYRVFLGAAGGHGIYNTGQAVCNWPTAAGSYGAGFDGGSCGTWPNGLLWGTGNGSTATYDNRSGTWEHWLWW